MTEQELHDIASSLEMFVDELPEMPKLNAANVTEQELHDIASSLEMFVEELPEMPKLKGYMIGKDGHLKAGKLRIGMFQKKWVQILYIFSLFKYSFFIIIIIIYL